MLNFKLLNIRDILLIAAVTVAVHVLAKPIYQKIDAAIGSPSPDAS